jgi:hypothetical protein
VTLEDLNAKRSKEFEGLTMEAERLKTEHKMRSKSAADAATSLKIQLSMEQSKNSKLMAVQKNAEAEHKRLVSELQSKDGIISKLTHDINERNENIGILIGLMIILAVMTLLIAFLTWLVRVIIKSQRDDPERVSEMILVVIVGCCWWCSRLP